jgi:hypothetical protein
MPRGRHPLEQVEDGPPAWRFAGGCVGICAVLLGEQQ